MCGLKEAGCKVRVISLSLSEPLAIGHAWRARIFGYLQHHPWTKGPLSDEAVPGNLVTAFNNEMYSSRERSRGHKNRSRDTSGWVFTSSDLTAATDNVPHDVILRFIEDIELKLCENPGGVTKPAQIPELRVLLLSQKLVYPYETPQGASDEKRQQL